MDRFRVTQTTLVGFIITLVIACLSLAAEAQIPNIPQSVRKAIELTLGAKGIYIPSEGVFKVRMVRNDIQQTEVEDGFPGILPDPWSAFGPAFHQQAIVTAEFSLLDDEITPVTGAALDSGLQITSLANSTTDGPRVFTLDTWELGDYGHLASGEVGGIAGQAAVPGLLKTYPATYPSPEGSAWFLFVYQITFRAS